MAKYIIDVPDEAVEFMGGEMNFLVEPKIKDERKRHYVLRIDEEDTSIYTEPDRKAIEDKVWEFATTCTKMDGADSVDVFGGYSLDSFTKYSYQEAKSKYDAWKKQKDEIHIGDEVKCRGTNGVVVRIDTEDRGVNIVLEDGDTAYIGMANVIKTGRYFDEVENLLKKMEVE